MDAWRGKAICSVRPSRRPMSLPCSIARPSTQPLHEPKKHTDCGLRLMKVRTAHDLEALLHGNESTPLRPFFERPALQRGHQGVNNQNNSHRSPPRLTITTL